jgi:hypothetical protein
MTRWIRSHTHPATARSAVWVQRLSVAGSTFFLAKGLGWMAVAYRTLR